MTVDLIAAIFLLLGVGFILVASVGVVRLPDLFTRMHAITKAGTTGVGCVMIAVLLAYGDIATTARALAVLFFVALTAPVAAHMISRAAYLAEAELWEGTFVDELREYREARGVPPASVRKRDLREEDELDAPNDR